MLKCVSRAVLPCIGSTVLVTVPSGRRLSLQLGQLCGAARSDFLMGTGVHFNCPKAHHKTSLDGCLSGSLTRHKREEEEGKKVHDLQNPSTLDLCLGVTSASFTGAGSKQCYRKIPHEQKGRPGELQRVVPPVPSRKSGSRLQTLLAPGLQCHRRCCFLPPQLPAAVVGSAICKACSSRNQSCALAGIAGQAEGWQPRCRRQRQWSRSKAPA